MYNKCIPRFLFVSRYATTSVISMLRFGVMLSCRLVQAYDVILSISHALQRVA